ncbi:putative zinc finger x-linked protein [Botrytis fragariae]|uniref:Putative zinc finger x-linked protein n=1 Tax=Botrytis fragariae TaxID=1964551 RepID=A0A8H6B0M2_9HELO|nr:putative zinc finger x-linked protein [Botrytis fragariae]KAF5876979.1 putative zinc finger x-linked protein [Botrytis fragariae]
MDGSYDLSPEDITAESWQEFVDWDAANPVDMGTEAASFHTPSAIGLSEDNARLTHYLIQCGYGAGYTLPNTTCATCSSELDTSELALYTKNQEVFCTKSKALNHPPLSCVQGCGSNFHTLKGLEEHCRTANHEALHCPIPGCFVALSGSYQGKDHLKRCHGAKRLACHQCEDLFENTVRLDSHARRSGHSAYICRYPDCESTAGRISDLIRHQACHKKDAPRHPCPHCRTYRGNNGFKRKDHLRQHIRNYHKIESNYIGPLSSSPFLCENDNCQDYARYRIQNLRSLDDLIQHMLTEHNSSVFICDKMSCDRVGLNGFDTKKLLQDHIKKEHPSPFQCTHPGCDRVGSKGWFRERDQKKHMFQKHGISV